MPYRLLIEEAVGSTNYVLEDKDPKGKCISGSDLTDLAEKAVSEGITITTQKNIGSLSTKEVDGSTTWNPVDETTIESFFREYQEADKASED